MHQHSIGSIIVENVREGDDGRIHSVGHRLFFRITTVAFNALAHPRSLTSLELDLSQPFSVSHDANGLVTALGGTCTSVGRGIRGYSFDVDKTEGHRHEDETIAP